MIVVNGVIATTAENIKLLKDAIVDMQNATLAEEGCVDYSFAVELSNPTTLRLTERWQSEEALRAHFNMPHMAEFQSRIGEHPPSSVEVKFYRVEEFSLQ